MQILFQTMQRQKLKEKLLEIGKEAISEGNKRRIKPALPTMGKAETPDIHNTYNTYNTHNTQKEISEELGWSNNKVAQADVI